MFGITGCMGAVLLGLLLPVLVSCSSTRQIVASPPRSAVRDGSGAEPGEKQAPIAIVLNTGSSELPPEVSSLRFRVAEVWLRQGEAGWLSIPTDLNQFEIKNGVRPHKSVLSTLVPPAAYDSIGLTFSDVFVLFDANAGGPLTLSDEEPLRLAVELVAEPGATRTITLAFEPGASLYQDEDCRWFLLPVVLPAEGSQGE